MIIRGWLARLLSRLLTPDLTTDAAAAVTGVARRQVRRSKHWTQSELRLLRLPNESYEEFQARCAREVADWRAK